MVMICDVRFQSPMCTSANVKLSQFHIGYAFIHDENDSVIHILISYYHFLGIYWHFQKLSKRTNHAQCSILLGHQKCIFQQWVGKKQAISIEKPLTKK